MSETTASLHREIGGAGDLRSVGRTMKAVAASSIGQYEASVQALVDDDPTVEVGLGACLRESGPVPLHAERKRQTVGSTMGAVMFGSDQGPVGQLIMWWPTMRSSRWRRCRPNPRSGPSVSVFMHTWRTRACCFWDACRAELRQDHHPARGADSHEERDAPQSG